MQRLSASPPAAWPPLPAALLALLCAWQAALSLAFALRMRPTDLPGLALGALARGAVPLYAAAGVLLWVLAHELAHALAARCCGVRGGRLQWSPLLPAFRAPAQPALDHSGTRFLVYIAGPVLDLLCSLALAVAALLAPAGMATVLQSLFVLSLLVGLPNCWVLAHSDMGQAMRAFGQMCGRRWPSTMYGLLSLGYAGAVILMAVKLILRSRPGIV